MKNSTEGFLGGKKCFCFTPKWLWQELSQTPHSIVPCHGATTCVKCHPSNPQLSGSAGSKKSDWSALMDRTFCFVFVFEWASPFQTFCMYSIWRVMLPFSSKIKLFHLFHCFFNTTLFGCCGVFFIEPNNLTVISFLGLWRYENIQCTAAIMLCYSQKSLC